MANYPKSFNFRNGLQVDNDNFVVSSAGLVGIGTSSPQAPSVLDVHGGARILGLATVTTLGVTGVSTFYDDLKVGTGISFDASAGEITATNVVANTFNGGIIVAIATAGWTFEHGGAGISTFISVGIGTTSDTNYDLRIGSGISFTGDTGSAFYSGVVTATTFDGNLDAADLSTGTIPGARFPATLPAVSGASLTSLNASSISSGTIDAARVPTLNQDTTGTAAGLSGSPDTVLGVTTTGSLSATSIGIGTSAPTTDLQIKKESGDATLEVISDAGRSSISIGNSVGAGNSSASINYGSTNGFGNFSTPKSFDIINRDTGYINYFLSNSATNSGFVWHRGPSNQLMSLTHDGYLGIGITNPTHKLDVQGISTFTGNAHFNGSVTITGSLIGITELGATLTGDVKNTASDIVLDVSESLLNGNVNSTSGISTFNNSKITRLGVSTPPPTGDTILSVCSNERDRFHITGDGNVGIKTTATNTNIELDVNGDVQARHGLVVGQTTTPKCAIDMSSVVDIVADGSSRAPIAYMIPPRLTTAQRNALTDIDGNALSSDEAGAMIYNTQTNKLQVWNGSTWNDCF